MSLATTGSPHSGANLVKYPMHLSDPPPALHYRLLSRHTLLAIDRLRSEYSLHPCIYFYHYWDHTGRSQTAVSITHSALLRYVERYPLQYQLRHIEPWAGCTQELCSLPF